MENASKALIIAGAILLAILIIGLGVFIYRQAAGVIDTGAMDQLAVNQFNAQFEPYLNNNVSGSNVKQLVKTIVSSNRSAEDDSKKVTINGCEVTATILLHIINLVQHIVYRLKIVDIAILV